MSAVLTSNSEARQGILNQLAPFCETPAFVYDEAIIKQTLQRMQGLRNNGCRVLYSLKAFTFCDPMDLMVPFLDGFATSSLFESRFARTVIADRGTVHLSSPGLKAGQIAELANLCDFVSFNSISQWNSFQREMGAKVKCGLRLNPQLSFVKDDRYNPCRKHSKLGVPMDQLVECQATQPGCLSGINGLHFHTNCDSNNIYQLRVTVQHIESHLASLFQQLAWINMGGGYLFEQERTFDGFVELLNLLQSKYKLEIFIEPGAAFVRDAVYLVTTVIDLFPNEGKTVAILDTTVNHMPEVFEYQFAPDILNCADSGRNKYTLAGCSCLAGDVFGEYAFQEPLAIGSRIVFYNVGAYSFAKAHMFNGINLPNIYALTEEGELVLTKSFGYEDFASRCGVNTHAVV